MHGYVLAVWFCFTILTAVTQPTDPSEVNALLHIKKTLIDPMYCLSNWNKGDPCLQNWTGVWCFDRVGNDGYFHVHEIYLMNMNLSGSIAPQFGQLLHLQTMNLMWNNLTGSIPKEIGNITSLKLLLLNGNNLSGNLPDELGRLANLSRLQVDQNQLSGPIPESFSNLNNVRHLHMSNNSFSGQIPHKLSKLSKLLHLLVDNNNLSGYLPPELSMLPGLRILQLDNNNFSGTGVPSTYVRLSTLVKLSLRNCSLQGTVPDFSSIPNLSYLDLSWNHLSGPIPSNNLSDNMTTIDLSNNNLNGSIPRSFSYLPLLQKLSLENNFLSGPIPTSIWQNISFSMDAKLEVDFRNNSLSNFSGILNPPASVTLRLAGNPICKKNANMQNILQYCGTAEVDKGAKDWTKSKNSRVVSCPVQSCPLDNFYEYVPAASSPIPCFCASPLRIGYQLKSPSFSYFPPYISSFELYVTQSLNLDLYQLSIYSYAWEEGPRLSMYLKIFPSFHDSGQYSSVFNSSEVRRILSILTSWKFHRNDFFGPYELLNITLLGPYANMFIGSQRNKINAGILIAAIIAAVACILAITALVTLVITRRHIKYKQKLSGKHISSNNLSIRIDGMKAFTFKELALATDKFSSSTRVGQGGYGNVYKGILSDDTTVAIKRAEEGSLQGQKEFLTEIELLSRLHHRNLVSLIGFCNEKGEQMLVYEFMPNGTLRDWISGKNKSKESLDFGMRLRIAMDSARGILYLHTEANPPIFHRDIKASNILLDSKFTAKVADFGLSRLAPFLDDEGTVPNHVSTVVRGTPGYLDPEYLLTHKLTNKSDVYSLGIVFLELLTGMKPISHGKNIVREVHVARESGGIGSIIDSRIMGCCCYPSDCLDKFLSLALSCCHDNPEERPSMLDVVRELENILQLLQETETTFSDATSENSGKLQAPSSSTSASACNESMEGSNLVSGVIPTIVPR